MLKPFAKTDFEDLKLIFQDEFVRKFLWDDQIVSDDTIQDILVQNQKQFQEENSGLWRILLDDTTLGFVGLWYFFDEPQPQLIYGLLPTYTSKGYATEACRLILDYCNEKLHFKYLIAAMDRPHIQSHKVAIRIGMNFVEERDEDGKPTVFYRIDF